MSKTSDDSLKGKKTKRKPLSVKDLKKLNKIFAYLRPQRKLWALGFLFLLITMVTSLLFPKLLGGLMGSTPTNLRDNMLQMMGLLVIQSIASFFRVVIFVMVTERALAAIREDLYGHLIHLPMSFFSAKRVGELNSRVASDTAQIGETLTTTLAELLRGISMVIGGIAILAFTSIKLTLFIVGVIPPLIIVTIIFGKFIRKYSKSVQDEVAASNTIVEETFAGIQTVKAFANEAWERSRYATRIKEVVGLAVKGGYYRGAFASFITFGLFGAIALVIWFGAGMVHNGELAADKLNEFILYALFIGGSIGGLASVYAQLQKAIGATETIFDLMEEQTEMIVDRVETVAVEIGDIVFNQVEFSYPSRSDVQVLNGLSFKIPKGKTIALVGKSGSGKSTIASLLMRFYHLEQGGIISNSKPLNEVDLAAWREELALVPQDVLLFGGSIKENIAYGKTDASEAEIIEAAQQANAWEFIKGFPEGLETTVGERGVQLSGGQRQRIAIARALLKDPQLLILDEATSALDSESEFLVQEALDRLMQGRTSVVIAHRLSTIRNAHEILVINEGQITERGTHDQLLNLGGTYSELVRLQDLGGSEFLQSKNSIAKS
ncbi:ABC transporter transmembrane domain-containing protein [Schleiferiaceae bacterium]|jgi:ABC-type multidrug transport system fused ATPase/permease subunit|nr:ABC transporter transmembrane domain-containing protein [Schleiferiaceae bacterium]|tara:strand:- start:5742 stop:7562 length:1821 start_codon:yes stop_codon:yes gene_type:complete